MSTALCDRESCEQPACIEYLVRWTDHHQKYNVWRACNDHQTYVEWHLMTGAWSGGVIPFEFDSRNIHDDPFGYDHDGKNPLCPTCRLLATWIG